MASKNTVAKTGRTAPKTAPKPAPRGRNRGLSGCYRRGLVLSRQAWGIIWGVTGLLCLFAMLPMDGHLLRWLRWCVGVLFGVGSYLFPVALLALAGFLWTKKKGPVRLRSACIALLPLLFGSMAHGFLWARRYELSMQTMTDLWKTGMENRSGGILSGLLYIILEWAVSALGAQLVLIALTITALLIACHITPAALWDMIRPRPYPYGYGNDEEETAGHEPHKAGQAVMQELAAAPAPAGKRPGRKERPVVDIPIDPPVPPAPDFPEPPPVQVSVETDEADVMALNGDTLEVGTGETDAQPLVIPVEPPTPPVRRKTPTPVFSENEQAEMNETMDENQKAPTPVYDYPPADLLAVGTHTVVHGPDTELQESSGRLIDTLQSFHITARIIGIVRGPSVTRFELSIPRGVKIARISSLSDDIALSLGASSVRIAPIPDKVAVGIEVPNKTINTVYIRECIASPAFTKARSKLSFAVGKDITGKPVIGDIAKMPHLLIAGTTGSGKSVCINSMLVSILYKSRPEEVRLIMIDPKMVELGNYNGIPHLLIPVVTDPQKAAGALNWAVGEMERRYQLFADRQVRNLAGYNDLMRTERIRAEQEEGENPEEYQILPQIVIVIDELADLMMVAAKQVETAICRIAQKARAAGMHLVVATQRPSSDVITGIMKANIPSRIAFAVASQIESRIILDQTGAEKLIGKGDMLYAPLGEGKNIRVQGCFISSDEIESVISCIKQTSKAEYNEEILEHMERASTGRGNRTGKTVKNSVPAEAGEEEDEMLEEAVDVIMECRQASTSMLQRRLKLGYARAGRIMDQIEQRGIVGPSEGSKPRQILISRDEWKEMKIQRQDLTGDSLI